MLWYWDWDRCYCFCKLVVRTVSIILVTFKGKFMKMNFPSLLECFDTRMRIPVILTVNGFSKHDIARVMFNIKVVALLNLHGMSLVNITLFSCCT